MANTVPARVILESINIVSPGVGSMWEFSVWVNGKQTTMFNRVIKDGQTADFRKTLFAMDVPAKQPLSVAIQVAVREIDVISDYGNGGTTIAIDTNMGGTMRASFQARVTEKGGTRAGAVATLTFGLASEVGVGADCADCDKEFNAAANLLPEFETTAGELITTLLPMLAEDFQINLDVYDRARATLDIARGRWSELAKQLRDCAAANPKQVKAACLRPLERIETLDNSLGALASDAVPLLNTQADYMARRYLAFLAAERIDLEIALYEAQLQAKCEDDLDKIRKQLTSARAAKKDADANVSAIAGVEQKAERDAKKIFARFEKLIASRTTSAGVVQTCAANQEFGSCGAPAQALIGQDVQISTSLLQVQLAYQNIAMLLDRYNSQLSQQDDKLELVVENYTDALGQYTDCVARLA